jgi:N-methylhydantoinase B
LDRPIEDVEADAKQGYISLAAAKELYGVVLDPQNFKADVPATESLRAAMRQTPTAVAARAG